ncbi:hypothetical protein [Lentilitoribacter sp. Alg239-R112]|uniref:hypothetical protein n=1 Tax=Lentilitoribacter sp. Alg239-R112 TaxID=2305987 RepID=UPI0013A68D14|nr:hypothetical protein [Lentilitoribacter sp. Alg239-R112]
MRKTATILAVIIGCSLLLSSLHLDIANAAAGTLVDLSEAHNCPQGRHMQPNGNFAVDVYCDDALGTNIAFTLVGINAPIQGKYSLTQRTWQGGDWAASASSVFWSNDLNTVLVATDMVYGTGTIYRLKLLEQGAETIWSMQPGSGCIPVIKSLSGTTLVIDIIPCESGLPRQETISIN